MTSISVLIATHNRAAILRETLDAMTAVDSRGVEVEWIVVNNACTDETDAVLDSFLSRLTLRPVHEPIPSKNRAINRALQECPLGDIIVFSDDDVSPPTDWLQEIVAACERWPDHAVFGGRILPRWPADGPPQWLKEPFLLSIAFSAHDLGQTEMIYPLGVYPFGPNFWVRKELFAAGRRFAEHIGPIGDRRIMGSETSFLRVLEQDGYRIIYAPKVWLYHRLKPHDCDYGVLAKRAISYGRGRAWIDGVNYRGLLTRHPVWWRFRQALKALRAFARLGVGCLRLNPARRREYLLLRYIDLGRLRESLHIARMKTSPSREGSS